MTVSERLFAADVIEYPAMRSDNNELATVDQQIEQHAQNIERIQRDAVIEIGRELKQAQELFRFNRDEGGFEGWINSRLPHISRSAAYNAIQMFDGVGKYPELWTLSDAAKLQAATAEPDVKAIIAERVAAGEVFTAAQVKEIKAKAAEEAIEKIKDDAEKARQDLERLREEMEAKQNRSAGETQTLREQVKSLSGRIAEYDEQIAQLRKSLPKPGQAKEKAAEQGGVVLGSDGKFHSGSSPEQKKMSDAFLFAFDKLLDLTAEDRPHPSRIAEGCPPEERAKQVSRCENVIAYLTEIKDELNAKQS